MYKRQSLNGTPGASEGSGGGGAHAGANGQGATFEYLVKWIGFSHLHDQWLPEDVIDQIAPAKFGEYVLQYGRVPRMLADERWSKPQRVVA